MKRIYITICRNKAAVAVVSALIVCVTLLLASQGLSHNFFGGENDRAKGTSNVEGPQVNLPQNFQMYPVLLKTYLERFLHSRGYVGAVNINTIRKIKFDNPGTSEYEQDSEWQIFPPSQEFLDPKDAFKESIKRVSSTGNFIISLSYNVHGSSTDLPDLIALLPDIKKEVCLSLNKQVVANIKNVEIPQTSSAPVLVPYNQQRENHKIINITSSEYGEVAGCFMFDGKYYYYYVLYNL